MTASGILKPQLTFLFYEMRHMNTFIPHGTVVMCLLIYKKALENFQGFYVITYTTCY